MSASGRCPLLMSAIGRFFHWEFMVVHSGLQLFGLLFGGVRYSGCPLIGGLIIVRKNAKLLTQSLLKQKNKKKTKKSCSSFIMKISSTDLFGRTKHLKVLVSLFKRVRAFFIQKTKPKPFFLKNEKR